jgi:hypothetical protein
MGTRAHPLLSPIGSPQDGHQSPSITHRQHCFPAQEKLPERTTGFREIERCVGKAGPAQVRPCSGWVYLKNLRIPLAKSDRVPVEAHTSCNPLRHRAGLAGFRPCGRAPTARRSSAKCPLPVSSGTSPTVSVRLREWLARRVSSLKITALVPRGCHLRPSRNSASDQRGIERIEAGPPGTGMRVPVSTSLPSSTA